MLFIVHTVPDGGKVIFYRFVACTEPLEWLKILSGMIENGPILFAHVCPYNSTMTIIIDNLTNSCYIYTLHDKHPIFKFFSVNIVPLQ